MKIKIVVDKDVRKPSKRFKNEVIKVFESGDAVVSVVGNSVKVAIEHAEKTGADFTFTFVKLSGRTSASISRLPENRGKES